MWQIMAQMALDIARERAHDAEQQHLADAAREMQRTEARLHGFAGPSRLRALAASALRRLSSAFGSVSDAACDAATRLERRTA